MSLNQNVKQESTSSRHSATEAAWSLHARLQAQMKLALLPNATPSPRKVLRMLSGSCFSFTGSVTRTQYDSLYNSTTRSTTSSCNKPSLRSGISFLSLKVKVPHTTARSLQRRSKSCVFGSLSSKPLHVVLQATQMHVVLQATQMQIRRLGIQHTVANLNHRMKPESLKHTVLHTDDVSSIAQTPTMFRVVARLLAKFMMFGQITARFPNRHIVPSWGCGDFG